GPASSPWAPLLGCASSVVGDVVVEHSEAAAFRLVNGGASSRLPFSEAWPWADAVHSPVAAGPGSCGPVPLEPAGPTPPVGAPWLWFGTETPTLASTVCATFCAGVGSESAAASPVPASITPAAAN